MEVTIIKWSEEIIECIICCWIKNIAEEDAPFIIDSPLNAVDDEHQKIMRVYYHP